MWQSVLRHKVADNILFDVFILTRVYAWALFDTAREYFNHDTTMKLEPQLCFTAAFFYSIMCGITIHLDMAHPVVDLTMLWSCKDELMQYLKNQISSESRTLCKAINAYIDDNKEYYRTNKSKVLHNTVKIALSDIPLESLRGWKHYYKVSDNKMERFSFWRIMEDDNNNDVVGNYSNLYKNVSQNNLDNWKSNTAYKGLAALLKHCVNSNYLTAEALWLVAQFRMTWDMNDMAWWQWEERQHDKDTPEYRSSYYKYLNRVLVKTAGFDLKANYNEQFSKEYRHLTNYNQMTTVQYDSEKTNGKVKTENETTLQSVNSPTKKRVVAALKKKNLELKFGNSSTKADAFAKRKRSRYGN